MMTVPIVEKRVFKDKCETLSNTTKNRNKIKITADIQFIKHETYIHRNN